MMESFTKMHATIIQQERNVLNKHNMGIKIHVLSNTKTMCD